MSSVNFEVARTKICVLQELVKRIFDVSVLCINPTIYASEDTEVKLSQGDKNKLEKEYGDLKEEIETALDDLP